MPCVDILVLKRNLGWSNYSIWKQTAIKFTFSLFVRCSIVLNLNDHIYHIHISSTHALWLHDIHSTLHTIHRHITPFIARIHNTQFTTCIHIYQYALPHTHSQHTSTTYTVPSNNVIIVMKIVIVNIPANDLSMNNDV